MKATARITDPEEFLASEATLWCPHLRLRFKPGFCEELLKRGTRGKLLGFDLEMTPITPPDCRTCRGENAVVLHVEPAKEKRAGSGPEVTGAMIRRVRRERGMTQRQLGKRLGVSQQLVCFWETGRQGIWEGHLDRIRAWLEE